MNKATVPNTDERPPPSPIAGVKTVPFPIPIVGAGFWIRTLARIIDFLFGAIVLNFIVMISFSFIISGMEALHIIDPVSDDITFQLFLSNGSLLTACLLTYYGGAALYHTVCETFYGATLGKLFCKLRVLSIDNEACTLKSAFIRNIMFYFDYFLFGLVIGFFVLLKTPLKQRCGDKLAQTVVVHVNQVPLYERKPFEMFIVSFGFGSVIWGATIILTLMLMFML